MIRGLLSLPLAAHLLETLAPTHVHKILKKSDGSYVLGRYQCHRAVTLQEARLGGDVYRTRPSSRLVRQEAAS
jgi:hypothetical protein